MDQSLDNWIHFIPLAPQQLQKQSNYCSDQKIAFMKKNSYD